MKYIIPLDDIVIESHVDFHDWLIDNKIDYKIDRVLCQANGFPEGWWAPKKAIIFTNENDVLAFKLKWF